MKETLHHIIYVVCPGPYNGGLKAFTMTNYPLYSALHDGQGESEIALERVENMASPNISVRSHARSTEMSASETDSTVHTQNPKADTEEKRPGFDWNGTWAWEIGSVTLAVGCIVLLVVFLVQINNTPYAAWQYTASPNTVVSIIVTIAKAAVLVSVSSCLGQLKWNLYQIPTPLYHMQAIDQASRGPWGSMEVLLRGLSGSKTGSLTYVGAFLTVLALAVDPFAQQILKFPSRTVTALNATAFTQASQQWSSTADWDSSDVFLELQPSLLIAMMSGLLQAHNPLEPQCDSTSCEFPEFVTLGMCSKCEDVTSQTKQECKVLEHSDAWESPEFAPAYKDTPLNCSYKTPNKVSFNFEKFQSYVFYKDSVNLTFSWLHWSSRPREDNPAFDIQTPIISLTEIDYIDPVVYNLSNVTAPPTKPLVTECAVYICERQYSASSYLPGTQKGHPMQVVNTQQLIARNVPEEDPTRMTTIPVRLLPPDGLATLSKNASYTMDHPTFNSFKHTMMRIFNNTAVFSGKPSTSDDFNLATILRRGNLSQLMDSMATSVTDALRNYAYGSKIQGEAFRVETFIQVRWPWIILPVIVTLGSIALLLGTAIGSKQCKTVLWKCMLLPLLSSHLHTLPENEIASMRRVKDVTDKSKKMRALMVQDEGPLTFREQ